MKRDTAISVFASRLVSAEEMAVWLSQLEREAMTRIASRIAATQLGEAFKGVRT